MRVKGEGRLDSKIWLIGEAPGKQEDLKGKPFCGGAGMVLNDLLIRAKIKREECYVDNIMQTRPPGNDFGHFYKDKSRKHPTDALFERQFEVRRMIKEHRPNVVVPLGNEALKAVVMKDGIMKWRGSILGCGGVKVIPTIHPAMVMRQYDFFPISLFDFKRIKEESLTPEFPRGYRDNFIINPTFEQVMGTLDVLHKQPYVSFDIETAGKQIVCIGFGWSKEDAICIPIFYSTNSWWSEEEEIQIVRAIRHLFANPEVNFIAQNAQFDMVYLADKWGVEVRNLWMDTMIAFHTTYPELKKGLDFLCSIYTKRPYYKDMPGTGGPTTLWEYNCLDTVVTWESAMEIRKELEEFGTMEFYLNHSHKLIKPLIQMQRRGVRIDLVKRREIEKNLVKDEEDLLDRLHRAIGHPLNPNSPKQMKEFLYEELKLPIQRNRATGNVTADENAIEALARRYSNPVLSLIIDIRKIRKLLSTYIRVELDEDGRIRTGYQLTGTVTGRLSARESVYGTGSNLQQIPRGELIRGMFIPDKGMHFINADLSQAEARMVAYLSQEERLQRLFERGGDVHKENASIIFKKPLSQVSGEERQLAKTLIHASNYGIGPRTFARYVGIGENEGRDLLNRYYTLYPRIKMWHREIEMELKRTRTLITPLGRKRTFFGRWGPDLLREAIAYIPQSTVSDLLNLGIVRAFPNLPPQWELLMQVHDSVLLQVPVDADPMHVYKFVKHYFEIPLIVHRKRFVIPIEIKVGMNWGKMEELRV